MESQFTIVGTLRDNERQLFLVRDDLDNFYCHPDPERLKTSEMACYYSRIENFISFSLFYPARVSGPNLFETDEELATLQKLQHRFPQPDLTVVDFVRFIETTGTSPDLNIFKNCRCILSRTPVALFNGSDKNILNFEKPDCFLVEAIIDHRNWHTFSDEVQLFLQIIDYQFDGNAQVRHQELTPELLRLTQLSAIDKYRSEKLHY